MNNVAKCFLSISVLLLTSQVFAGAMIKSNEAKNINVTLEKELHKIFLDKKGGLFAKSLLKTPLTQSEISTWNSVFKKIKDYATRCGFNNQCGERSSLCSQALPKLQVINEEVLESLKRINVIFKSYPKEAKKLAAGEIDFLKHKGEEATQIASDLLVDILTVNIQMVTDSGLLITRYGFDLTEICNFVGKQLSEK